MSIEKINEWALPHVNQFRTYIDIGAHNGDTCIDLVDTFQRVYAFEPNPESIKDIPDTIKKFPFALGNKKEELVLTIPDNGYNNNKHGSIVRHQSGIRQYSVSVKTLDGFEFKEVDLIKIDVEGMELEVLEGAIHTIMKWRPVVLFENKRSRYNKKLVDFFNEISYTIKVYKSDTVAYYE
jgi:FkbM family methyltransferase|tara:strand:+ start:441 stop:980 length:540 start_codon:yes stop_codon:yes gene_type:complete